MSKEKELLRKQLELLAEQSGDALPNELSNLSAAMCKVYDKLKCPTLRFVLLFAVLLDLLVSILILVK